MSWDRSKGRPEPIRALDRVRECENGEPLVDMRLACPSLRMGRSQVIPWCRKTVAEMAEAAARSLPPGVFMALNEAWRPIERQARIHQFFLESAREAWPHLSYPALKRIACRWSAPTDHKAPPGHCTGAAIDLNLVDEEGKALDMSSPLEGMSGAPTHAFGLSAEARHNRFLLVDAMLAVGFSNCRDEWWHYSYGDAGWAVRLGLDACIYGLVHLPEDEYAEQERVWIEQFAERKNPFVRAPK